MNGHSRHGVGPASHSPLRPPSEPARSTPALKRRSACSMRASMWYGILPFARSAARERDAEYSSRLSGTARKRSLHRFHNGADGSHPAGTSLRGKDGKLYGTTDSAGAADADRMSGVRFGALIQDAPGTSGRPNSEAVAPKSTIHWLFIRYGAAKR